MEDNKLKELDTFMYKILGLPYGASLSEIKKAMHELVQKYHPDRSKSIETVNKFIEVREAYEYLTKKDKINDYMDNYVFIMEKINSMLVSIKQGEVTVNNINNVIDDMKRIFNEYLNLIKNDILKVTYHIDNIEKNTTRPKGFWAGLRFDFGISSFKKSHNKSKLLEKKRK